MPATADIAILLLPGFSIGEFSQISDVFTLANQEQDRVRIRWEVYGVQAGSVTSSAGIAVPCRACTALDGKSQTLIVVGPRPKDPSLWAKIVWAVRLCNRVGAVLAVGDGVEVLAALGLLDGKKACAHWLGRMPLRERFHDVDFTDRLFAIERSIGTCAGASTTIDFALELIAQLISQDVADRIACRLNCEKRRNGQQLQRHVKLARYPNANRALASAIEIIQTNEDENLDARRIAAAVGVSHRQLQRLFQRYLKKTPSQYLRAHRLQLARELLARTPMSVTEVAIATGFANPSHFAVRYSKAFGIPPSTERVAQRFG